VGGILARAVPFNGRLEGIIVGIGINVNTSKEELDRMRGPFFGYLQIQYSVLI
jgi:biotin-(acetyl-CoA carboxylase) ligase